VCLAFVFSNAQQLTPTVVSSSGGFYSNTNGSLSFTVGELTMVETFQSSSGILTQGFQQPTSMDISVPEIDAHVNVLIFPNPSNGNVKLSLSSEKSFHAVITVYDNVGKVVATEQLTHSGGTVEYPYNWENLAEGIYHFQLSLFDMQNTLLSQTTTKINIIK
jgi:hypothetical protein